MSTRMQPIASCVALLIALLLLPGCDRRQEAQATATPMHPSPPIKPAPATPILTKRVELGGATWDPEWDKLIETAIPREMLSRRVPHDVRIFCHRFYELDEADKRAFWAYFFQALAGAEAGLDPTIRIRHTEPEVAVIDKVTGRTVRSEGLLQLTYEDEQRYGCNFDWERDKKLKANDPSKTILRPENNLECGVKILKNQIIDQHKPLLSRSSYWSTLRPGTTSYRVFAKQMTNVPIACRTIKEQQMAKR